MTGTDFSIFLWLTSDDFPRYRENPTLRKQTAVLFRSPPPREAGARSEEQSSFAEKEEKPSVTTEFILMVDQNAIVQGTSCYILIQRSKFEPVEHLCLDFFPDQ